MPHQGVELARYPVEEILPLLGWDRHGRSNRRKVSLHTPLRSYRVKVATTRLECLKRNQSCIWCGITGNVFVLGLNSGGNEMAPHLNLYYLHPHGGLTLMTQDHLIPRSKGGTSNMDNLATMCCNCNRAKDNLLPLQFVLKMTRWPREET